MSSWSFFEVLGGVHALLQARGIPERCTVHSHGQEEAAVAPQEG